MKKQHDTVDPKLKETLQSLTEFCSQNGRICPNPQLWNKLFELLPNKKRKGGGWEPSLPLILAVWYDTPPLSKMIRLKEHLKWAEKEGCLDEIGVFLRALKEDDWHHLGSDY